MKMHSARYTSPIGDRKAVFDFWHADGACRVVVAIVGERTLTTVYSSQGFLMAGDKVAIDRVTMAPECTSVQSHASAEPSESHWAKIATGEPGVPESFDAAELRVGDSKPEFDWVEGTPVNYLDTSTGTVYRWTEGMFLKIARARAIAMIG